MPGITTTDNIQHPSDEKPKLSEQIDLEEAEAALIAKDYKTARPLLEKLGKRFSFLNTKGFLFDLIVKLDVKGDDEDLARIKESAILAIGKLFKETKDAKGIKLVLSIK
jgi:hypothetical protein